MCKFTRLSSAQSTLLHPVVSSILVCSSKVVRSSLTKGGLEIWKMRQYKSKGRRRTQVLEDSRKGRRWLKNKVGKRLPQVVACLQIGRSIYLDRVT